MLKKEKCGQVSQSRRWLLASRLFGDGQSSLFLVRFVLAGLINRNALRNALVVATPGYDGVVGEVEHALDGFTAMVSDCSSSR